MLRMQALSANAAVGSQRASCPVHRQHQQVQITPCQPVVCPSVGAAPDVRQHHTCCAPLSYNSCSRPTSLHRMRTTTAAASSQAAAPAAPAEAQPLADPCLNLTGIPARSVGALLGSMCGNALGAQVEPEKHYRLARLFPQGLQDLSWSFDISPDPLLPCHVTGDYVTMLAVALSIARSKGADTFDIINCLASSYMQTLIPGNTVRYSPYTQLALESLASGELMCCVAHVHVTDPGCKCGMLEVLAFSALAIHMCVCITPKAWVQLSCHASQPMLKLLGQNSGSKLQISPNASYIQ
eukprot:GHUV01031712.1.p1 GENE.GHUV01031712.1~~GHUV01031712.1.p1  ORF type:complete len:296 (+),score=41.39 GHUV01031712.1:161-1048(+)